MQSIQYPHGLETEFYTGTKDADILKAMDADLVAAEAKGGHLAHRGRIGRNSTCPCSSTRKFKKCCMAGAKRINTI